MMRRILMSLSVLALVVGVSPMAVSAPWCGWTADQARRACVADAWAGFHLARGICANQSPTPIRAACGRAARTDRDESFEECEAQYDARLELCETFDGERYLPDFSPENFVELNAKGFVDNPFLSLTPGDTRVVRTGDDGQELVVITVTDRVRDVAGVQCRIVVDAAIEVSSGDDDDDGDKNGGVEYEALELTDDWFALHVNGDVWYCGEAVQNYEDGELTDLDGSFEAGTDGAQPGILIEANPMVGNVYRQEFALGEAEDVAEVVSLASGPAAKGGGAFDCNGVCLQTFDSSPLDPGHTEFKYYLPGIGFIFAESIEDGEFTGEVEEVVCQGDSIAILSDPACGIEDPELLLEVLCRLSPDTYCD